MKQYIEILKLHISLLKLSRTINKIFILFVLIFISCTKKEDLELEIISKEIKCLAKKKEDNVSLYIKDKKEGINKNAKTIITYKLKNNCDKTYYFNFNNLNNNFEKKFFYLKKVYLKFTDENNIDVKIHKNYYTIDPTFEGITKEIYDYKESNELNYNFIQKNQNFIIHPNEIVYFEYFIVLPYGNFLEGNANWIELDSNKSYFAEILMSSDSTNYRKTISRVDLQTIKENGYEVYHGVIKSKNKIPIKFVALPK